MRVVSAVGNMRRRDMYKAVRDATVTAALRERIRIVQISIQRTHVHMLVDPFSSGISFPDWKELDDKVWMWPIRETYEPLIVRRPESWLLREGWKRCGSISVHDVPSKRP